MQRIENKETLYDGLENQELYTTIFNAGNSSFKLSEILDKRIEDLKNKVSNEDLVRMAMESGWQPFRLLDFEESYRSEEGLMLYYAINDHLLHVYAFGEKQPGRYVLKLEGGWKL